METYSTELNSDCVDTVCAAMGLYRSAAVAEALAAQESQESLAMCELHFDSVQLVVIRCDSSRLVVIRCDSLSLWFVSILRDWEWPHFVTRGFSL
jgi:hypothetical protein